MYWLCAKPPLSSLQCEPVASSFWEVGVGWEVDTTQLGDGRCQGRLLHRGLCLMKSVDPSPFGELRGMGTWEDDWWSSKGDENGPKTCHQHPKYLEWWSSMIPGSGVETAGSEIDDEGMPVVWRRNQFIKRRVSIIKLPDERTCEI